MQPSLFAKGDGPGCSLVYYFGLPDGWTPDFESNKVCIRMLHASYVPSAAEASGLSMLHAVILL